MRDSLLFDFSVNKEKNTIHILREFNANLELVWAAWTKPEIIDQWWAPKPYRTETKFLDFRVGGMWLYAMISPAGEKHWCKAEYKAIEKNNLLSWLDAFCDKNGNENTEKPRSFWTNIFTENNGITTVNITLLHNSRADMEMMIKMGFREGLTMAFQNLDDIIEPLTHM